MESLDIFKFFIFLDIINYIKYVFLLIFYFQIRQTAESDKYVAIKRLLQVGCTKGPFCSAKRPRRKVIATVYVFGRSKDMSDMNSAFFNVHSCFFGWCDFGRCQKKKSKASQVRSIYITSILCCCLLSNCLLVTTFSDFQLLFKGFFTFIQTPCTTPSKLDWSLHPTVWIRRMWWHHGVDSVFHPETSIPHVWCPHTNLPTRKKNVNPTAPTSSEFPKQTERKKMKMSEDECCVHGQGSSGTDKFKRVN